MSRKNVSEIGMKLSGRFRIYQLHDRAMSGSEQRPARVIHHDTSFCGPKNADSERVKEKREERRERVSKAAMSTRQALSSATACSQGNQENQDK